jgi:hypothetical protein
MKKVILLVWLMPALAYGQISETFESGSLPGWIQSNAGRWKADSISSISGNFSLHHSFDNADAGTDAIGLEITNLKLTKGTVRWSFMLRHGSEPSSSNNWAVFLLSDNGPAEMHPGGNINGFALGVNFTGSDDTLRLWKVKGGVASVVLSTPVNWQNNIGTLQPVQVEAERSVSGLWRVTVMSIGGVEIGAASATDPGLFNPAWFGLLYRYTSTRDRLLWLDDLTVDGVFISDREAPVITGCFSSGKNSLDLTLDEEPDENSLLPEGFVVNGNNTALQILKTGTCSFRVTFEKTFINKSINNLVISRLCDKNSNCKENVSTQFSVFGADQGDVIISEIMADPSPRVGLPEEEYLEIYNTTGFTFGLKDWILAYEGGNAVFPETVINPGEFLIVCSIADTSLFSGFGKAIGVKSFPALTNEGRWLVLADSTGQMIHGAEYSDSWYSDKLKAEGGWSLEIIDTDYPFNSDENWKATVSPAGGTPGKPNSVSKHSPDLSFTGITNVFPADSCSVRVSFSEPVREIEKEFSGIKINGEPILALSVSDPIQREFIMEAAASFRKNKLYTLTIPLTVTDFAGNRIEDKSFVFGIPENAGKNDIVFNELLFNPLPGDADYIELYNLSGHTFDASQLFLVSVSDETGDTSALSSVSESGRCFLPGTFYAVSADPVSVVNRYFSADSKFIFPANELPSMPDNKGHLVLLNRMLEKIDEVKYNENMHFSLLSDFEGKALEKVRPVSLSGISENWHSASETSGWGTPGAPNSICSENPSGGDKIVLSSTRVSPDNDGYEDLLVIDFNLEGNGNVLNVSVFDENGKMVRNLADNLFAGSRASIVWDGTSGDGSLLRRGIYIILISVYDDTGKTEKWKKVCAVIR